MRGPPRPRPLEEVRGNVLRVAPLCGGVLLRLHELLDQPLSDLPDTWQPSGTLELPSLSLGSLIAEPTRIKGTLLIRVCWDVPPHTTQQLLAVRNRDF